MSMIMEDCFNLCHSYGLLLNIQYITYDVSKLRSHFMYTVISEKYNAHTNLAKADCVQDIYDGINNFIKELYEEENVS